MGAGVIMWHPCDGEPLTLTLDQVTARRSGSLPHRSRRHRSRRHVVGNLTLTLNLNPRVMRPHMMRLAIRVRVRVRVRVSIRVRESCEPLELTALNETIHAQFRLH